MTRLVVLLGLLALAACGGGPPAPAALDTRHDACAWCRMTVSDARSAAQIVAPGALPLFFDDLGCLSDFLAKQGLPRDGVAYVADHRTGEWIEAAGAVITLCPDLATPMNSHLVAHRDAASRDLDPATRGGSPADLGPALAARVER